MSAMLVNAAFEGMLEQPINPKVEGPGSVLLFGTLVPPDDSYPGSGGYPLDLSDYMSSVTSIIIGEGVLSRAVYDPATNLVGLYHTDNDDTGEFGAVDLSTEVFPFVALGVGKVV